jgi:hypothetical protein
MAQTIKPISDAGLTDEEMAKLEEQGRVTDFDPSNSETINSPLGKVATRTAENLLIDTPKGLLDLATKSLPQFSRDKSITQNLAEVPKSFSGYNLINNMVLQPSMNQLHMASQANREGRPEEAGFRAAASFPMIGPAFANQYDSFKQGGWEQGTGDAIANALLILAGEGARVGGAKIGEMGAAESGGVIPGARQFAVETEPPGFFKGIAYATGKKPSGIKLSDTAVRERNIPIETNFDRLLSRTGPEINTGQVIKDASVRDMVAEQNRRMTVSDEAGQRARLRGDELQDLYDRTRRDAEAQADQMKIQNEQAGVDQATNIARASGGGQLPDSMATGNAIRDALADRAYPAKKGQTPRTTFENGKPPSVADLENTLWKPVTDAMNDVVPDVTEIQRVASQMAQASEKAQNLITSELSPATQKIIGKAAKIDNAGGIPDEFANVSPEMKAVMQEAGGDAVTSAPPTWQDLHTARQEIDSLIARNKGALGTPDTRALNALREEITSSLRNAITDPEMLRQFDKANAMTRYKHKAFGEGFVEDILQRGNPVKPSEIVEKLLGRSPEDAAHLKNSMGVNDFMTPELRTAVRDELLKKHTAKGTAGKGAVDYRGAAYEALTNPTVKALLGPSDLDAFVQDLNRMIENESSVRLPQASDVIAPSETVPFSKGKYTAQTDVGAGAKTPSIGQPKVDIAQTQRKVDASNLRKNLAGKAPEEITNQVFSPGHETDMADISRMLTKEQRRGVHREGLKRILNDSDLDGVVNGPKFADLYEKHRALFKASGMSDTMLKQWDAVAKELKGYHMSSVSRDLSKSGWGGVAETGVAAKATAAALAVPAAALFTGHPAVAAGVALSEGVYLLAPKVLLNVMLEPAGPNLVLRYLANFKDTGKWSPAIGKAISNLNRVAVTNNSVRSKEYTWTEQGLQPR